MTKLTDQYLKELIKEVMSEQAMDRGKKILFTLKTKAITMTVGSDKKYIHPVHIIGTIDKPIFSIATTPGSWYVETLKESYPYQMNKLAIDYGQGWYCTNINELLKETFAELEKYLKKNSGEVLKSILQKVQADMNEELQQPPNERTDLASMESLFKSIAKRPPTPKEKNDSNYKDLAKYYDEACDAWSNVAYQYRVGDEDSIKRAQEELDDVREINVI